MPADDGTVGLFFDIPFGRWPPRPDDFVVAVGEFKSGQVYLVKEVRAVRSRAVRERFNRYQMRCFKTDLPTLARRERDQVVFTLRWYSRDRKHRPDAPR